MKSFPTYEELKEMSIARIQALDVNGKEQEELVQKVLDEKRVNAPLDHQVYRGDIPDILTKADEIKYQKIVDAREASRRPGVNTEETEVDLNKLPDINLNAGELTATDEETDVEPDSDRPVAPANTDTTEFGDLADEEPATPEELAGAGFPVIAERSEAEVEAEIAALESQKQDLLAQ